MAWYRNHYHCGDCGTDWEDEWSCNCDDDCPSCGSRHWSPVDWDDLTETLFEAKDSFVVMQSPPTAEHEPSYAPVAKFPTRELAMRFVVDGELT
jgi:hypothetical protein